jgi:glycine hydroxymethyltransferase
MKEEHMPIIVEMIDDVIRDIENENLLKKVTKKVNDMMASFPIFAY